MNEFKVIDVGIVNMTDFKTVAEVAKSTGMKESLLEHNISTMKRRKVDDPAKLIAGIDYIHTRGKVEKYTPHWCKKNNTRNGLNDLKYSINHS